MPYLVVKARLGLDTGKINLRQANRELKACQRHCLSRLLQWRKGPVKVARHVVSSKTNDIFVEVGGFDEFAEEALRVAITEIEARGFEHETFEAYDGFGVVLEDLISSALRMSLGMSYTNRVIWTKRVVGRSMKIHGCTEDVARFLERVLDLAGSE